MSRHARTAFADPLRRRAPPPEALDTPEKAFDLLHQLLEERAGEPVALTICGVTAAGLFLTQTNVAKHSAIAALRRLADELERAPKT